MVPGPRTPRNAAACPGGVGGPGAHRRGEPEPGGGPGVSCVWPEPPCPAQRGARSPSHMPEATGGGLSSRSAVGAARSVCDLGVLSARPLGEGVGHVRVPAGRVCRGRAASRGGPGASCRDPGVRTGLDVGWLALDAPWSGARTPQRPRGPRNLGAGPLGNAKPQAVARVGPRLAPHIRPSGRGPAWIPGGWWREHRARGGGSLLGIQGTPFPGTTAKQTAGGEGRGDGRGVASREAQSRDVGAPPLPARQTPHLSALRAPRAGPSLEVEEGGGGEGPGSGGAPGARGSARSPTVTK